MNVGQLLKLLEGLDPNTPVLATVDDGDVAYTFGEYQFTKVTYPGDEYMDDIRFTHAETGEALVDGTYVIINISE